MASVVDHYAKTIFLHVESFKKSETTHRKVGQHEPKKLNCHHYITSQSAYHNFSIAGGIIRLRAPLPSASALLLILKKHSIKEKQSLLSID